MGTRENYTSSGFVLVEEEPGENYFSPSSGSPSRLQTRERRELKTAVEGLPSIHSAVQDHKMGEAMSNKTHVPGNTSIAASSLSSDEVIASTTKDTAIVFITLTIIFFTLIATYLLWRRHRSSQQLFSVSSHCKLEEYRYSRLSQNDIEVDNISFQGDLTQKTLINSVPVCAEEDPEDDQIRPATLPLYDSLTSISKDETSQNHSSNKEGAPINLLIDEFSDEDLLQ